jgi:uncharacterized protein
MNNGIDERDIEILRGAGMSQDDITHSVHVAKKALEIAGRCGGVNIDMELVARGALFHDLGKAKTHEMEHGRVGAEMGRALGLPSNVLDLMEKHIRGGLTPDEARELGLPVKDYALKNIAEKVVIYADRLVDIIHDGIVRIKDEREAELRFEEILRAYPQYGKNDITLARYLGYHAEIQGLMAGR